MPLGYYASFGLHRDAKLTSAEKTALIDGLTGTIGPQAAFDGRGPN